MFQRWKFTVLLVAILLLLVVRPFLTESATLFLLLYSLFLVVFVVALFILFRRRSSRLAAALLGLPTVASILTTHFLPERAVAAGSILFHLLPALFFLYTVVIILKTIFQEQNVSADSINGAFCGYLVLGLAFAHLYCLVDQFWLGSFALKDYFENLPPSRGGRHSLFIYFSLVTLTTLGYGDITPRSGPAQALAWLEAMMGQFYVAVIIAELIALKVSAALRENPSDRPSSSGSP
jgi:hypothetical protein